MDDLTEKLRTAMASGLEIEASLGRCSACREEISEKSVLVGEETFHEACFVCSACSARLTGRYYLVSGQYYCEEDREVNLPRCGGCHHPLTGQFLTIAGQSPHQSWLTDLTSHSRPGLPPGLFPLQCLRPAHPGEILQRPRIWGLSLPRRLSGEEFFQKFKERFFLCEDHFCEIISNSAFRNI